MLEKYLQAQQQLRRLADTNDLEKYYDIYDISPAELRDVEISPDQGAEDRYSLRSLRNLFSRFYTTRKGILCCLLSLGADGEESDITRWSTAIEEMRNLVVTTATFTKRLADILNEQDRKCTSVFQTFSAFSNFHRRHCTSITIPQSERYTRQRLTPCPTSEAQFSFSRNPCSTRKNACDT